MFGSHAAWPLVRSVNTLAVLYTDDHQVASGAFRALIGAQPEFRLVEQHQDGDPFRPGDGRSAVDVVVIDSYLPRTNAIQATATMRGAYPQAGILLLGDDDEIETLRQLFGAGATGHLLKCRARTALAHAIRVVASGRLFVDSKKAAKLLGDLLGSGEPAHADADDLTGREAQVLQAIAKGYSNREVAGRLMLSVKTIETYKARSMEKLRLNSRVDLVRYAAENGWLQPH